MFETLKSRLAALGIFALCFGYFASYVPYSMMLKVATDGLLSGGAGPKFTGFEVLPVIAIGVFTGTYAYLLISGWWRFATRTKILGVSVPRAQWFTFVSGICTAGQILTTALAYTFTGVSIVFAMLLMRGGVLIMAPIVDLVARKRKRKIYWPSWIAAGLSLAALLVAFNGKGGLNISLVCGLNIAIYLFVYFFRLLFMSNKAKSDDENERKRYFAEEQLVANPALIIMLLVVALFGINGSVESIPGQIYRGFATVPHSGYFMFLFMTGIFSFGTGLFGSLIFLDKRENTFTVPANRCSSVIAGVIATYVLAFFYGQKFPGSSQMIGVGLILAAIIFLSYRQIIEKRELKKIKMQEAV